MCAKGSTVLEFKKQILEDMTEQKVKEAKDMAVNRFVHSHRVNTKTISLQDEVTKENMA